MVWSLLGKVIESNSRFALIDSLEVLLDHVRRPVGNDRKKTKGRSILVLSAIKKSIVTVEAALLCLVHALIIAMARINGNPKYASYRDGNGLKKLDEEHLKASDVDLYNTGGFEELSIVSGIPSRLLNYCV